MLKIFLFKLNTTMVKKKKKSSINIADNSKLNFPQQEPNSRTFFVFENSI